MPRPSWPLLLLPLLALAPPRQDGAADPSRGRESYLGREIARTMHWTGADWLLRETREDEENGALLRRWLDVRPGGTVCDFGCGNGYHTLPLARAVGEEGRVLAVDLQLPMLAMLRDRVGEEGLANVEVIEAEVDDPRLPPDSCDLVLMVDVYHELTHPVRVLAHVRRALKPDGRLVLVEFRAEDTDVPIKRRHRMTKAQVVRELAANGFRWVDGFDGLPWQHAMAFTAAGTHGRRLEQEEVLRAFWRAVRAGDAAVARGFLAEEVDVGADRPRGRDEVAADLAERVGETGKEGWAEERSGWELSVAERTLLARRGVERERVELLRDEDGALRVDRWWRRRHAHPAPLVAMNTATGRGTPEEQVELVAEAGYGGVGWGIWRVEEVRALCEARGMDLWSVYVVLDVTADPDPREERLGKALAALDGGPGQLWLVLESGEHELRDPAGDDAAERTLDRVLEVAARHGVEVALYPHTGSWMERAEDALRLLERVDDPRLGLCFNLCHWLRNHEPDADPTPLLRAAGPRLHAVTINGADHDGSDWSTLIRPLDEGTYEVGTFLELLEAVDFAGPVGLQGFGLEQPPREHLSRSMEAWRELRGR